MPMRKVISSLLVFHIFLIGLVGSVHSADYSQGHLDGIHLHFDDFGHGHDHDDLDAETENGAHAHFPLFTLLSDDSFLMDMKRQCWEAGNPDYLASQTYSPPVPPPDHLV